MSDTRPHIPVIFIFAPDDVRLSMAHAPENLVEGSHCLRWAFAEHVLRSVRPTTFFNLNSALESLSSYVREWKKNGGVVDEDQDALLFELNPQRRMVIKVERTVRA
jgi:hypothetical protein